jgi:hypothetical protein
MTRYERLQKLNADEFKRAMGVQIKTFKLMLKLLREAQKEKMKRGGRPCLLSIEDHLIFDSGHHLASDFLIYFVRHFILTFKPNLQI